MTEWYTYHFPLYAPVFSELARELNAKLASFDYPPDPFVFSVLGVSPADGVLEGSALGGKNPAHWTRDFFEEMKTATTPAANRHEYWNCSQVQIWHTQSDPMPTVSAEIIFSRFDMWVDYCRLAIEGLGQGSAVWPLPAEIEKYELDLSDFPNHDGVWNSGGMSPNYGDLEIAINGYVNGPYSYDVTQDSSSASLWGVVAPSIKAEGVHASARHEDLDDSEEGPSRDRFISNSSGDSFDYGWYRKGGFAVTTYGDRPWTWYMLDLSYSREYYDQTLTVEISYHGGGSVEGSVQADVVVDDTPIVTGKSITNTLGTVVETFTTPFPEETDSGPDIEVTFAIPSVTQSSYAWTPEYGPRINGLSFYYYEIINWFSASSTGFVTAKMYRHAVRTSCPTDGTPVTEE